MLRHTDDHPIRNEEEYFARRNLELVMQMRARLDAERQRMEREAHHMKCPDCGADLDQREIEHVKVDVCPECHGVWFPKGEIAVIRQLQQSQGVISRMMSDILDMFHHTKPSDSTATTG